MYVYSDTISLLHKLNMNSTQFWLVGEDKDFQMADSSTATTTLLLPSGIWFFPALNGVNKQFMKACRFLILF